MELGTAQAPDTHLGQFPESGACPSTRCPQAVIRRLGDTSQPPTSAQQPLGPWLSCTSRYQHMVIPRARSVSEPQTPTHGAIPRSGDISQPRLPVDSGPVARDVSEPGGARRVVLSGRQMPGGLAAPGRHLVPPTPSPGCATLQSWPSLVTCLLAGERYFC